MSPSVILRSFFFFLSKMKLEIAGILIHWS